MPAMFTRLAAGAALMLAVLAHAQEAPPSAPNPRFDAALAQSVGADERGMRGFVLVVLKTGPQRMPAGPARDEMFKGHFANMKRLVAEGKLVLAGPFDGVDGWRGLFIFAVTDVEEARRLVATDPVVSQGEMVPEFHRLYASAALMLLNDWHGKLNPKAS